MTARAAYDAPARSGRGARRLAAVPAAPAKAPRLLAEEWLGESSALAWAEFCRAWRLGGKSEKSLASYSYAVAHLARHMGHGTPGAEAFDATPAQVAACLQHLSDTASAGTRNLVQRSLRSVLAYAVREDIIDASPVAGLPTDKGVQRAPATLTAGQLRDLLATCDHKQADPGAEFARIRDAFLLRIMCEAGCPRRAEMAGINLDDLDLTTDTLLVRGKGRKERRIALSGSTAQAGSRYLRARAKFAARHRISSPRLWLACKPTRAHDPAMRWVLGYDGIRYAVEGRGQQAGLDIHAHQLRHVAYARFSLAGGTDAEAMAAFGWSTSLMCQVYGRTTSSLRAQERARRIGLADLAEP